MPLFPFRKTLQRVKTNKLNFDINDVHLIHYIERYTIPFFNFHRCIVSWLNRVPTQTKIGEYASDIP